MLDNWSSLHTPVAVEHSHLGEGGKQIFERYHNKKKLDFATGSMPEGFESRLQIIWNRN